jgi:hypothetical protein
MTRTVIAIFVLFRAAVAPAEIIGSHSGDADPNGEGWELAYFNGESLVLGMHLGSINVDPVTGDMGSDAWEIVDTSSVLTNGGYSIVLTPAQEADAISHGFVMRTTMKPLENSGTNGARVFVFGTTESSTDERWVMAFGANPSGDPTVSVQGGGVATLTSAGPGYHTFEFKLDPAVSKLATVSIDGVEVLTDQPSVPAEGNKPRFIYFGSWSNNGVGGARYSMVEFEILSPLSPNADFDHDSDVDGDDFLTWQRNVNLMGQSDNSNGDANFDGTVNGADLAVWEAQYGSPPPVSAVTTVPEPASTALFTVATLLFFAAQRSRRVRRLGFDLIILPRGGCFQVAKNRC